MADAADAAAAAMEVRRERRRRRILENADDRIKRFTNVKKAVETEATDEHQIQGFGISKYNLESPEYLALAGEEPHRDGNTQDIADQQAEDLLDEDGLFGDLYDSTARKSDRKMQQAYKAFNYHKVIVLLLGIAVRYINLVFENGEEIIGVDLSYLHMDSIFIPFLIYEITEFFVYPPKIETSSTLHLILTLNNLKGRGVNIVVNIANNVLRVLKDMSVYFFAYVFLDMVFALFNVDDEVV